LAGVVHCVKCGTVVLLAFHLDHARLKPQLAGRLGCCIALLARNRVKCDSDDSRARERLASDLDAFGGELELAYENARNVASGTRQVRHISLRQSKSMARNAIGLPSAAESAARSARSFPTARNTSTLRAASSR
jgi:hypothetical protein